MNREVYFRTRINVESAQDADPEQLRRAVQAGLTQTVQAFEKSLGSVAAKGRARVRLLVRGAGASELTNEQRRVLEEAGESVAKKVRGTPRPGPTKSNGPEDDSDPYLLPEIVITPDCLGDISIVGAPPDILRAVAKVAAALSLPEPFCLGTFALSAMALLRARAVLGSNLEPGRAVVSRSGSGSATGIQAQLVRSPMYSYCSALHKSFADIHRIYEYVLIELDDLGLQKSLRDRYRALAKPTAWALFGLACQVAALQVLGISAKRLQDRKDSPGFHDFCAGVIRQEQLLLDALKLLRTAGIRNDLRETSHLEVVAFAASGGPYLERIRDRLVDASKRRLRSSELKTGPTKKRSAPSTASVTGSWAAAAQSLLGAAEEAQRGPKLAVVDGRFAVVDDGGDVRDLESTKRQVVASLEALDRAVKGVDPFLDELRRNEKVRRRVVSRGAAAVRETLDEMSKANADMAGKVKASPSFATKLASAVRETKPLPLMRYKLVGLHALAVSGLVRPALAHDQRQRWVHTAYEVYRVEALESKFSAQEGYRGLWTALGVGLGALTLFFPAAGALGTKLLGGARIASGLIALGDALDSLGEVSTAERLRKGSMLGPELVSAASIEQKKFIAVIESVFALLGAKGDLFDSAKLLSGAKNAAAMAPSAAKLRLVENAIQQSMKAAVKAMKADEAIVTRALASNVVVGQLLSATIDQVVAEIGKQP